MSSPIVFISHHHVQQGRHDDLRSLMDEVMPTLERERPRTLAMLAFLDTDAEDLSIIHVFGDGDALDEHFEGATERARRAAEITEPLGWEIHGAASSFAVGAMRERAEAAGVELRLFPTYVGGFLRAGVPQAV